MIRKIPTTRRGFSLVEVLTVITIITMLVALTVGGVYLAVGRMKDAQIALEIQQLQTALASYQADVGGSFPPDFTNRPAAQRHLAKAFPRYVGSFPPNHISNRPERGLDPAEALVFWLGGYSAPPGTSSSKLLGFRADPSNPFVALPIDPQLINSGGWTKPKFDFVQTRLVDQDGDGWYEYLPPNSNVPYVYFDARSYDAAPVANPPKYVAFDKQSAAIPYSRTENGQFTGEYVEPKTYQIISAGQDSSYGSLETSVRRGYPDAMGYATTGEDNDNITSFSEGTLEDQIP